MNRADVIRTRINLPKRKVFFDHADPLLGRGTAITIKSTCWTQADDFFVLDDQNGIHKVGLWGHFVTILQK